MERSRSKNSLNSELGCTGERLRRALVSIVHQWAFVDIVEEGALPFTIFLLTNSILFSSCSSWFDAFCLHHPQCVEVMHVDDVRDEQESEDETLL
jgi:hypothetical protein